MPALAAAVITWWRPTCAATAAPPGGMANYDSDMRGFRLLNAVRDALGLVFAIGYRSVAAVLGHDFGSPVGGVVRAGAARRVPLRRIDERPVRRAARPAVRYSACHTASTRGRSGRCACAMAALPRPRKHYQWYYSTRAGQRRHAALRPGRARVPACLLPSQKRRLDSRTSRSGWPAGPLKKWRRCRPITSWT